MQFHGFLILFFKLSHYFFSKIFFLQCIFYSCKILGEEAIFDVFIIVLIAFNGQKKLVFVGYFHFYAGLKVAAATSPLGGLQNQIIISQSNYPTRARAFYPEKFISAAQKLFNTEKSTNYANSDDT